MVLRLNNIEDNIIGSVGGGLIAYSLEINKTIKTLNLSKFLKIIGGNDLKVEGAISFSLMLKQNKTLKELNLSTYYWSIGNNYIRTTGAQHLLESLENNKTLTVLSLSIVYRIIENNNIDYSMMVKISEKTQKNIDMND